MKRRPLSVAAALMATASLLLLTACGSGDDNSKSKDETTGRPHAGGATTSVSPSAGASGPTNRPDIALPKGVENRFEGWKTGDRTEDAVLSDVAQTVNAVDDAIVRGDTNSSILAYYRQGKALVSAQKWVQAWLDEDLTWTGVTRYFDPNVKVADSDTAAVVYCADESKAYNKNRKTGKVDKTPSDESPYVTYSTQLKKNSDGVWQTTEVLSKRGGRTCAS
ncbi:hypothetical protein [Streptomyces sp. XY006]|uniref:hypothetical protein n=1 Tax=Streptomyces sp. XY006 TaxID=2021410 RepID=UPI000B8C50FF|nr:hypothetical protein [Streptomyces sp. XY006]OXS31871.1 hypothetical protein CHR28_29190 [Streptomyces sp. XY006]